VLKETPSNLNYGADQIIRRADRNHLEARTHLHRMRAAVEDVRAAVAEVRA
jgi:hypothetical protein